MEALCVSGSFLTFSYSILPQFKSLLLLLKHSSASLLLLALGMVGMKKHETKLLFQPKRFTVFIQWIETRMEMNRDCILCRQILEHLYLSITFNFSNIVFLI